MNGSGPTTEGSTGRRGFGNVDSVVIGIIGGNVTFIDEVTTEDVKGVGVVVVVVDVEDGVSLIVVAVVVEAVVDSVVVVLSVVVVVAVVVVSVVVVDGVVVLVVVDVVGNFDE